jgi:hypothetical protein
VATQDDVRRIALSLPGVSEGTDRFEFAVLNREKWKGLAWIWSERVEPKKPRIPRPDVIAVRVNGEEAKDFLLHAAPDVFFTEPHYNGFPAILIRLEAIDVDQLETLLIDAWHIQAPKALIAEFAARMTASPADAPG